MAKYVKHLKNITKLKLTANHLSFSVTKTYLSCKILNPASGPGYLQRSSKLVHDDIVFLEIFISSIKIYFFYQLRVSPHVQI